MKKFLKKLKGFIIKNKLLSVLILIFLLIIVFGLVVIKSLIFPSYNVSKYGNRLNGIDSVKLDDSRFNEIKDSFSFGDGISISKFRLSGRIVNIFISASGSADLGSLKDNCLKLVKSFSEEELKFYDFQVFVSFDSDRDPIIGYKNKNSEGLYWNYEGGN